MNQPARFLLAGTTQRPRMSIKAQQLNQRRHSKKAALAPSLLLPPLTLLSDATRTATLLCPPVTAHASVVQHVHSTVVTMDAGDGGTRPAPVDGAAIAATATAAPAAVTAAPAPATLIPSVPIVGTPLHSARPLSSRRPARPVQPLPAVRSDLPYWLAWLLHAADLDDLPVPAALFHRSILSSPLLYWLLSCALYVYCVTQHYNAIRSPPLLARHPHYHWTAVSLRRYEQCVLESWMAAAAFLCCGACVLLLSVSVLSAGPHIALVAASEHERQRQDRGDAMDPPLQPSPPQMQRKRGHRAGSGSPEQDSADQQHAGNWQCIAVLAVLFFAWYVLRNMATIKWPQYRHGNVWSVVR